MRSGHQQIWHRTAIAAALILSASFAGAQAPEADDETEPYQQSPEEKAQLNERISACRARYEQVDAQIDKAGVRDVGYYLVPGYPYMRSDRLLASFRVDELKDLDSLGDWLHQLRDNDGFSRDIELQNLGIPLQQRVTLLSELRLCAVWLSQVELGEDPAREKLVSLARVATEPLNHEKTEGRSAKSKTEKEIKQQAERARKRFAAPDAALGSQSKSVLWKVKPATGDTNASGDAFEGAVRDALGRVGLTENRWEVLATRFAPSLLIEANGAQDRIGSPQRGADGAYLDLSTPVVDFQVDYARVGSQSLVQFSYFIWYPKYASEKAPAADSAKVDGLIWRVTLDAKGNPLAYDTIHANGSDHLWFPLAALHPRPETLDDTVVIPQPEVPVQFVVRLGTGGHEVRRLVAAEKVNGSEVQQYQLRRYEKLLTLPLPGGGTGSLFGPDGAIADKAGPDVPQAGAAGAAGPVRQWGHHAVSLRHDVYFDDPRLLERHFIFAPSLDTKQMTTELETRKRGG